MSAKDINIRIQIGLLNLTKASRFFDYNWYCESRNDLKKLHRYSLLYHYLAHGHNEGLSPSPLISREWVDFQLPRLIAWFKPNPLLVLSILGYWISPHPLISSIKFKNSISKDKYRNYYKPIKQDIATKNRCISTVFDQEWYVKTYSSSIESDDVSPIYHYLSAGWKFGCDPSPMIGVGFIRQLEGGHMQSIDPLTAYLIQCKANKNATRVEEFFVKYDLKSLINKCLEKFNSINEMQKISEYLERIDLSESEIIQRYSAFVVKDSRKGKEVLDNIKKSNQVIARGSTTKKESNIVYFQEEKINALKVIGTSIIVDEKSEFENHEYFLSMKMQNVELKNMYTFGNNKAIIKYKVDRTRNIIPEGIDLNGNADCNYFHFMIDIVPRVLITNRLDADINIPFIINDSIPETFIDIIRLLTEGKREIIKLKQGCGYKFRRLISINSTHLIANMYIKKHEELRAIVPLELLLEARYKAQKRLNVNLDSMGDRRIYIRRKNSRNATNRKELEELLFNYRFEFISPEDYTAEMQIKIFSQSRYVIAATGAAVTNLIWAAKNSNILVFLADHPLHQGNIWEDLALLSKSKIKLDFCKRKYSNNTYGGVHDEYTIDLDKVRKWLADNQIEE